MILNTIRTLIVGVLMMSPLYAMTVEKSDVRIVQSILVAEGFPIGRVDGKLGKKSEAAIRRYLTGRRIPNNNPDSLDVVLISLLPKSESDPRGIWRGIFKCQQDRVPVTLVIYGSGNQLKAIVEFGHFSNRGRTWGIYTLGASTPATGTSFYFKPRRWIEQPRGFSMVGLKGKFNALQWRFTGRINHPNCGNFEFTRPKILQPLSIADAHEAPMPVTPETPAPNVRKIPTENQAWLNQNPKQKQKQKTTAFVGADTPLTPENMRGIWSNHVVYVSRSGFNVGIERRISYNLFDFGNFRNGKIDVRALDTKTRVVRKRFEVLVKNRRKKFYIRLTSNSAKVRKGVPFYSLTPLRNGSGVDLLREGDSDGTYFVRFRRTKEAVKAGFGEMTFSEFCDGPAQKIAKAAKREIETGKTLSTRYPAVLGNYPVSRAARYGLFLSNEFKSAFKTSFNDIPRDAQNQLLERLKYCAAMHPDERIREPLAAAILNTVKHNSVRGFLQLGNTSRRLRPLRRVVTGALINGLSFSIELELEKLKKLAAEANVAGADLESIAKKLKLVIRNAPPSLIEKFIKNIASGAKTQKLKKKRLQEEELERNGPDLSETQLVTQASKRYFTDNCNRAVLAMRAAQKDGNLLGALLARSVKAKGGACVVTTATHILRFGVRHISSNKCTFGANVTCNFYVNWFCSMRLNPAFGFSSSTANFDPYCPIVRRIPVQMKGQFVKKSRRKWQAVKMEW